MGNGEFGSVGRGFLSNLDHWRPASGNLNPAGVNTSHLSKKKRIGKHLVWAA
jgi:hypothetical protein